MLKPGKHTTALKKGERAYLRKQSGDGKGLACTEFAKSRSLHFTKPRYWLDGWLVCGACV